MKIGDYIEKTQGYASTMDDMRGKTGLVVSLVTYSVDGVAESGFDNLREPKLIVLTG